MRISYARANPVSGLSKFEYIPYIVNKKCNMHISLQASSLLTRCISIYYFEQDHFLNLASTIANYRVGVAPFDV